MKKLLLAVVLGAAFASGQAGAAEATMTIDFVGDWCLSSREGNEFQYQLPSWRSPSESCTDIFSINKYGFYINGLELNCDPVSMRLEMVASGRRSTTCWWRCCASQTQRSGGHADRAAQGSVGL